MFTVSIFSHVSRTRMGWVNVGWRKTLPEAMTMAQTYTAVRLKWAPDGDGKWAAPDGEGRPTARIKEIE